MRKKWTYHVPVLALLGVVSVLTLRRDDLPLKARRLRSRPVQSGESLPRRSSAENLRGDRTLARTTDRVVPEILQLPESEIERQYRKSFQVSGGTPPSIPLRPEIPDVPPAIPPKGGGEPKPEPREHACPQDLLRTGATAAVGSPAHDFAVGHDGSAQVTIPLTVPPGPNGMQPRLDLAYNSRNGNGLLGVGWQLAGLSRIRIVRRNLAEDGFLAPAFGFLGGNEAQPRRVYELDGLRLVAVRGVYGADGTEYRTRPDVFSRIVSFGPAQDRTWKVWTKDGTVHEYGTAPDSRTGTVSALNGIFHTYHRTKSTDPAGNRIRYVYETLGGPRAEWGHVLKRIEYGGNERAGKDSTRRIEFHYREDRPDVLVQYADGVPLNVTRLLERITMHYGPDRALVREYRLRHESNPTTGTKLLREMQEVAADGAAKGSLLFDYTGTEEPAPFELRRYRFKISTDWVNSRGAAGRIALSRATARCGVPLDMNGDGRDDVLVLRDSQWYVQFGGEDGLGEPQNILGGTSFFPDPPISAVLFPDGWVELHDILPLPREHVSAGPGPGPRSVAVGLMEKDLTRPYSFVSPQTFDYDGDGRMEIMFFVEAKSPDRLRVVPHVVSWTEEKFRWYELKEIEIEPFSEGFQPSLQDIDGDGRKDLLYHRRSPANDDSLILAYRLLTDRGFGEEYRCEFALGTHEGEDWTSAQHFLDVDGDGATDLIDWRGYGLGWTWIRFLDAIGADDRHFPHQIQPRQISIHSRSKPYVHRQYLDTGFGSPDFWGIGLVYPLSSGINRHPVEPRWVAGAGRTVERVIDDFLAIFGVPRELRQETGILRDGDGQPEFFREIRVLFEQLHLLDINGDGTTDVVWWEQDPDRADRFVLWAQLNTGRGFDAPYRAYEIEGMKSHPTIISILDYDGDGRSDLLLATVSIHGSHRWPVGLSELGFIDAEQAGGGSRLLRSTGTAFEAWNVPLPPYAWSEIEWQPFGGNAMWNNYPHWGWYDQLVAMDVNGDGLDDVAYTAAGGGDRFGCALNRRPRVLLRQITDGYGARTRIQYRRLNENGVHAPGESSPYPTQNLRSRRSVVSRVQKQHHADSLTTNTYNDYAYAYEGGRVHLRGRGELGFLRRTVRDERTGSITTYSYDLSPMDARQNDFPYAGIPTAITEQTPVSPDGNPGHATRIEETLTDRHYELTPLHEGATYALYPATETVRRSRNSGGRDTYLITTTRFVPPPEDQFYGDPLQVDTQADVFDFGSPHAPAGLRHFRSVRTERRHIIDADRWLVALPRLVTETVQVGDDPASIRTTEFDYYPNGLVETRTDEPDGDPDVYLRLHFDRDPFGNVTQTRSTPGEAAWGERIEETDFDEHGIFPMETRYFSAYEDAEGRSHDVVHRTRFCWHPGLGVQVRKEEPGGLVTAHVVDGFGRIHEERRPDGTATRMRYASDAEHPLVITEEFLAPGKGGDRSIAARFYDLRERLVKQKTRTLTGEWSFQKFEYDAGGRRSLTSIPDFLDHDRPQGTRYEYDTLDRLVTKIHPDRIPTRFDYDRFRATVQDRMGRTSEEVRDPWGRIVASMDALGTVTRYDYDGWGNLARIVLPGGAEARMEYDVRGRRTRIVHPDLGEIFYRYDGYGQIRRRVHEGEVTDFDYDSLGRMIRRWNAADGEARWRFDQSFVGRLAAKGFGPTSASYAYDALGRLERETLRIEDREFAVGYSYDPAFGELQDLTYPNGLRVRHRYNDWGRLRRLESPKGGRYWEAKRTDAFDRIDRELCGNGVWTDRQYQYPWRGLLTELKVGEENDPTSIAHLKLIYDAMGNLKSREHLDSNLMEEFPDYDPLDRLKAWKFGGPAGGTFAEYAYDALGNLRSKTGVGEMLYEDPARPHRLTGLPGDRFAYDARGNLSHGMGLDAEWNSQDKPKIVRGMDGDVSLVYDADGHRVMKRGPRGTTYYVEGLYELRVQGKTQVATQYLRGPNGVVAVIQSEIQYVHTDALGSVIAVTDSKRRSKRLFYDPFGRRLRNDGSAIDHYRDVPVDLSRGFTGQEHDDELNLVNMGGRILSPALGRFLSPDPILRSDLGAQGLNPYSYVYNNPFRWTDPTGLQAEGEAPEQGGTAITTETVPTSGPAGVGAPSETPPSSSAGDRSNPAPIDDPVPPGLREWRTGAIEAERSQAILDIRNCTGCGEAILAFWKELAIQAALYPLGGFVAGIAEKAIVRALPYLARLAPGVTSAVTRSVWALAPAARGKTIHQALGENLPRAFPVIDRFENGVATSIKTMDIGSSAYQRPAAVLSRGKSYVDKVARFRGAAHEGVTIEASQIGRRGLDLAVPRGASGGQWQALQEIVTYGEGVGVDVRIIVVP